MERETKAGQEKNPHLMNGTKYHLVKLKCFQLIANFLWIQKWYNELLIPKAGNVFTCAVNFRQL